MRYSVVKLHAHRPGLPGHASGEQNVSKGNFVHIVPLDPAYPNRSGRSTLRPKSEAGSNGSAFIDAFLPVIAFFQNLASMQHSK
jgi:hypothetical protein